MSVSDIATQRTEYSLKAEGEVLTSTWLDVDSGAKTSSVVVFMSAEDAAFAHKQLSNSPRGIVGVAHFFYIADKILSNFVINDFIDDVASVQAQGLDGETALTLAILNTGDRDDSLTLAQTVERMKTSRTLMSIHTTDHTQLSTPELFVLANNEGRLDEVEEILESVVSLEHQNVTYQNVSSSKWSLVGAKTPIMVNIMTEAKEHFASTVSDTIVNRSQAYVNANSSDLLSGLIDVYSQVVFETVTDIEQKFLESGQSRKIESFAKAVKFDRGVSALATIASHGYGADEWVRAASTATAYVVDHLFVEKTDSFYTKLRYDAARAIVCEMMAATLIAREEFKNLDLSIMDAMYGFCQVMEEVENELSDDE